MLHIPTALGRNLTKWAVSRELLDNLVGPDGRDDDAGTDEGGSGREESDKECGLHGD